MRRLALVLAIPLCVASGTAQSLSDQEAILFKISAQIARSDILCSEFEQEKRLHALARPLLSSGKLIFVAEQGVLWQVLAPYPALLLIKSDELIRWDDDGHAHKLPYARAPIFRALANVFLVMFRGDFEILHDAFESFATQSGETWNLALTPKDGSLATAISEVRVAGRRNVEEISILEPRGDQTLIRFRNPRTETCKLEDSEKAYFAR